MKAGTKVLVLMAALAAGSASAAGVKAGTEIRNVATATYEDPNSGGSQTSTSPEVVTKVLANPGFDVIYRSNPAADGTTAGGTLPGGYTPTVLPGGTAVTPYEISNTGNVDGYVVSLVPDTTGTTAGGQPQPASNVVYYLDANNNGVLDGNEGAVPITRVTVPADDISTPADEGRVAIIQVITVPGTARPGESYAASPRGTGASYADGVNPGGGTITEPDTDLQFTRTTVYSPTLSNDPNPKPPSPGPDTPPGLPDLPGYPDPSTGGGTAIDVDGDNQYAYPKADGDANNDVVTFINSVKNSGTLTDVVNLFPTNAGVVNNKDGSFTVPVPGPDGTPVLAVVRFYNADGSAITVTGDLPTLSVPAGQTVNYRVQITYPDYDSVPGSNPAPITVTIGVDSGNDAGLEPDDLSTDVIYPSQLQFGDATPAPGTQPSPAPVQTAVVTAAPGTDPASATDRTAIFPMDVANVGEYPDTYRLSGYVDVPVTTSTTPTRVPVKYYVDSDGDGKPDTLLPLVNGVYTTPVVPRDGELKVWAVIDIPADALATNANGTSAPLPVQQKVVSDYSGITREDNNDLVAVTAVPVTGQPGNTGVDVSKRVDRAGAKPGEVLTYSITAKNNFNASLRNFVVTESNSNATGAGGTTNVFTWTDFQSVTATKTFVLGTGTVMYRFNGGAWQASPTAPAQVSRVDIGVDTNGDQVVNVGDLFPAGAQLDVTFQVKVK